MQRASLFALPLAVLSIGPLIAQLLIAPLLIAQPGANPRLTAELVSGLQVRNISGVFSSGRIADVAVDPHNRSVWYAATASGGLWKNSNRGLNWTPVFDDGGSDLLGGVG